MWACKQETEQSSLALVVYDKRKEIEDLKED